MAKAANYWDYYKYHTIAIAILVVMLIVFTVQNITKEKPDLTVAVFTFSPVGREHIAQMETYFSTLTDDINEDGQVLVRVKNMSFDQHTADMQIIQQVNQQLQAEMAGTNTLLYIADTESEEYFKASEFEGAFALSKNLSQEFYQKITAEADGELPENLRIYCRQVEGSVLEKEKGIDRIETEALILMDKITQ